MHATAFHPKIRALCFLSAVALSASFSPATTAEVITHWYFGVNYLDTEYDIGDVNETSPFFGGTLTINAPTENTNSTGWKLFAGYQLSRYLAVEVGYVDLGNFAQSGIRNIDNITIVNADESASAEIDIPGTIDITLKPKGIELAGVAISPNFFGLSVRAKAGFLFADYDAESRIVANWPAFDLGEESFPAITESGTRQISDSGVEALVGLGIDYRISNDWSFGLHWDRYFDFGNSETGEADIDIVGIDIAYHY